MSPRLFLLLVLLFFTPISTLEDLPQNRIPKWMAKGNPNIGPAFGQPEQVHLSYANPTHYVVSWVTFDDTMESVVEFGTDPIELESRSIGKCGVFLDGQRDGIWRYVHRANLTGLVPGTRYFYHVGSTHGWSPIFFFTPLQPRPDGGFEFAVYGDLGVENGRSLGSIQRLAQRAEIDMVLHVGDFAYNMNEENGETGDEFMRQIEPIAAYVPYMVAVGNHENFNNFTHYVNRFNIPNSEHGLYYSFEVGPVHFIVFSTEFYFYTNYGYHQIETQFQFLKDDLKSANANRKTVPWIITMGHRPMYCSDFDGDDCTKFESVIRTGLPLTHAYALEKLFYDQGVDIQLYAHEHTYERLWPVYNRTVYNNTEHPYVNPPAPVHIISGSAGCRENTDIFVVNPPPWSARRSTDYGFGRMRVYNETHLRFRQINVAQGGSIDDDFWVVKTSSKHHRPFRHRDLKKLRTYGTYISK